MSVWRYSSPGVNVNELRAYVRDVVSVVAVPLPMLVDIELQDDEQKPALDDYMQASGWAQEPGGG